MRERRAAANLRNGGFAMRMIALAALLLSVAAPSFAGDAAAEFLKAVAAADLSTVRSMLASDPALANAHSPKGTSAITVALFLNQGEGFIDPRKNEVLQAILAAKPNFDVFDVAAFGSAADLEAMLTDAGAVRRRNSFGWTLLHIASFAGNSATTKLLIEKGIPIDTRAETKFRNTPLQAALLSGQFGTAKILLDHGADAMVRQSKGFSPMHEAASMGRKDLVELLLEHGAEINSVADNGQTPLAEAIRAKHDDFVVWMKTKGAVVGVQALNDDGKKKSS
jgi:ankyrin repeat protein